jgi:hypothetical protein
MEDYIYILLAIVWLVISILGSRKKKQAQQQGQHPPTAEPRPIEADPLPKQGKNDFEELLDDFFGSETTTKEKPVEPQATPKPSFTQQYRTRKEEPDHTFNENQPDPELEKFQGADAITDDYEFSAEGKVETLEDLIKSYERSEQKILEEDAKISVVDLDEEIISPKDFEFDARKAIIYSEIINRKYT